MSHLLELLGRGLGSDLGDVLDRYFWSPPGQDAGQLAEACRREPRRPDGPLGLGLAQLRAAEIDGAIAQLSQACRLKPDLLAARLALASAYDEKGQFEKALDQLRLANSTHSGEGPVLFGIGFCLEKLGRAAEAAEYYRDAIAKDSAPPAARQRLAAIDVLTGNLDEAIEQYRQLRDMEPQELAYRSALAQLYHRAGRHAEAVEEFEAAIAMEPENWALVDDEVEALAADGQFAEAIARLCLLIDEQGPFADLHVRLGDLYGRVGDDEAAMRNYLLALELQPDYLEAAVKAGTQHLTQGRWEQAAEAFHQAAELTDAMLECHVGMGVAQAAMGNKAEAMNSFDLAGAIEPNGTILLAEMAKLQLRSAAAEEFTQGFCQEDQAAGDCGAFNEKLLAQQIERHAEAVRNEPNHADVRYRYGVLLRAAGQVPQAMEQFSQAVRISPAFLKAWIKLGITQQEMGLVDDAIETFRKSMDVRADCVDVHYRLGLLYTNRTEFDQAVRHMEEAAGNTDDGQIRAALALSLQNMGLMDRVAATWRGLWKIHRAAKEQ
jgi:tetratricopeptide (TPR) repeat protein